MLESAVREIRQRSRLTWDQLARAFGVGRRSVHFWARGARPSAENAERILLVLALVRHVDTGDAERTRAELLRPREGGYSLFELLCRHRGDEAMRLLRETPRAALPPAARPRTRRPPALSTAERERRRGLAPAELLDARHDRVQSIGRALGAIPVPGLKV